MKASLVPFHYSLKLCLANEEKFFGPGTTTLLRLISEHGSIRLAAKEMNMAYSKAWKMLKKAEENLGFPLLNSQIGGKGGGGTTLTNECIYFLETYSDFEKECFALTDQLFKKYFPSNR